MCIRTKGIYKNICEYIRVQYTNIIWPLVKSVYIRVPYTNIIWPLVKSVYIRVAEEYTRIYTNM